jgi:ribonuclease VapC
MNQEPEGETFSHVLSECQRVVGWPTIAETRLWAVRRGRLEFHEFIDTFISTRRTDCVAFDRAHEGFSHEAAVRFGKGRHPAQLNYGDCMTYAIARCLNLPLLFKGGDFGQTDIAVHPASVITA